MTPFFRKLFAIVAVLAASAGAFAQPTPPDAGVIRVEPRVQPPDNLPHPSAIARAPASAIAAVLLDPPSPEELGHMRAPSKEGLPLQVGFGRSVAALQDEAALHSKLAWTNLSGGRQVAAVSIRSPGATAIRAGLRIVALPSDAVVRFYAPGGDVSQVTGEEILETIARNLEAGENTADARTYWSPAVESDTLVVEFEISATTPTTELHVFIPQVSHLVTNATRDFAMEKAASASCELDVMCYSAWSSAESNAVARMLFTDAGSSYLCSGTLLADRDTSTTIPYFLSANHCISNQSAASTLQTYWFFRSTACNSGILGNYQTLTGGATLLYASNTTDTSFMKLNATPPAGAMYAGWIVSPVPALNTSLTAVHHPGGDLQKISFANLAMYATCTPPTNDSFTCTTTSSATSQTFYGVQWTQGITEPGSSGSGLFLNNGHYLIGQLYGGSSSCSSGGTDFYGRFDVAYNAALSQWLGVTAASYTLTVTKSGTGTGTVTSSPSGINCGSTCNASFVNGTIVTITATADAGSV
ncbi:MAG: trypsin-like serine peptidase, partial [Bacillota bacterium]